MIALIRDYYNLDDPDVLRAMSIIPRHEFLPKKYQKFAYFDQAVPIGHGQTMSQPYTVAFMTHLLSPNKHEKILEIGTGSGYQAAVLSLLCKKVYTIERISGLNKQAKANFKKLRLNNIYSKHSQGELGWQSFSPFDAILITADLSEIIPRRLIDQLKNNGRIIAPINGHMKRFTKHNNNLKAEDFGRFNFVPFVTD
jgi:protein-L-isoaspartate(D-aspartate) O-methyltransferase